MEGRLDFGKDIERIETQAEAAATAFRLFRQMQTRKGVEQKKLTEGKRLVRERLRALDDELNRYLAAEYGVNSEQPRKYQSWLESHHPFHWLVDFYAIVSRGGFDVVIGNPPYIELRELEGYMPKGYRSISSGNLYALVIEQCLGFLSPLGRLGMIVPVSSVSTDRYQSLQDILCSRCLWYSSYDDRPSRLFDGLEHIRLTIHLSAAAEQPTTLSSTRYHKWNAEERGALFGKLSYQPVTPAIVPGSLPKLNWPVEVAILEKLQEQRHHLAEYIARDGTHSIYYSRKVGYFVQVLDFEPEVLDGRGQRRPPSEFKVIRFRTEALADVALCCLNSNLFYWFVTVFSDCRHVNKREVNAFPVALELLASGPQATALSSLARQLMTDLDARSERRRMRFKHDDLTVQCIIPRLSKPILDRIDVALASYFGLTAEETNFIVNYDAKYRLGDLAHDDDE